MRFLFSVIVIFIICPKEGESSSKRDRLKLKMGSTLLFRKGEQDRRDIVGTPKRTNPEDMRKRRILPMDLITEHESQNPQVQPRAPSAIDFLAQYRAQNPRYRPKSPRKSCRKKYLPIDSNPLYPAELGPAPPNQLMMNAEMLSESQVYQIGLQRHGNYAPLLPKPPEFPSNYEAQPETYFNTEDEKDAFRISGQRFGNYSPLYPYPLNYHDPASEGSAGASGTSHMN